MFRLLSFCIALFLPVWRQSLAPNARHPFARTLTSDYLARKSIVKNFWIVSGALMVLVPVMPFVVGLALFTTFVSFMYLDEG